MRRTGRLRIYLGDLTYTTLSLATEAFPLNIGYVAAYCAKVHGESVEIQLFKYVDQLERALRAEPPDVLGLSNYPWNHSLGIEMFALAREIRPETLCVMGGPNISHRESAQHAFLRRCQPVDAYVYLEGELGFSNLVGRVLDQPDLERARILSAPIGGCLFLGAEGALVAGERSVRKKALDEFPSPYLEGFMDPFFDGLLSPMLETNRGCPFSCTFCHEGDQAYSKVNFFSLERVEAELDYIAERVPERVANLMFSDPNFGMYRRDLQICEKIREMQARTSWPRDIFATTGKNNRDRIAGALERLNGTMQMWMSVQSMDAVVLGNIRRSNIGLDAMMGLQSGLEAKGLPSKAEIILGLPGETEARHLETIRGLVEAGVDTITPYTLMLLNGTELESPESRERWGFVTRYRVLPRDFGVLGNGRRVIEVEEVVVASRDLAFEAYVRMRTFHLVLAVVYNGKPCAPLFRYLRQQGIELFPLLRGVFEAREQASLAVSELVRAFERETREELWGSEEELRAWYAAEENYSQLAAGEAGANLLQKYVALALATASEAWIQLVFDVAEQMLVGEVATSASAHTSQRRGSSLEVLEELRRYCTARVRGLLDSDRMEVTPEEVFRFDYETWMRDASGASLDTFRYVSPMRGRFVLSADQSRMLDDYLARFGRSHQGIGKAFTKMNIMHAWRRFVCVGPEGSTSETTTPDELTHAALPGQLSSSVAPASEESQGES